MRLSLTSTVLPEAEAKEIRKIQGVSRETDVFEMGVTEQNGRFP